MMGHNIYFKRSNTKKIIPKLSFYPFISGALFFFIWYLFSFKTGFAPPKQDQCSAEKFHNWGQCPGALEKVGTFEKKVGTLWGK